MLLKSKVKIENWLNKYNIKNYELVEDDEYSYVVNINEDVNLFNRKLKKICIKFNIINGDFDCDYNKLESLEGCPKIVNGDFNCCNNNLKTLDFLPEIIHKNFYCLNNKLKLENIKKLINLKITDNYIYLDGNSELKELQNIINFNEIKKILTIYKEKKILKSLLKNQIITNEIKNIIPNKI